MYLQLLWEYDITLDVVELPENLFHPIVGWQLKQKLRWYTGKQTQTERLILHLAPLTVMHWETHLRKVLSVDFSLFLVSLLGSEPQKHQLVDSKSPYQR